MRNGIQQISKQREFVFTNEMSDEQEEKDKQECGNNKIIAGVYTVLRERKKNR